MTDQLDFMKKQLDFYNESGNKTKAFTPYTYKYSDFERLRIMFDYGIDLDASICYLDFEKPFNYFMYQLRTLINYGVDTKLTIIVNTNIQSEKQSVTYIEYINSIVEANKIDIQLFCRSYSLSGPTLKFLNSSVSTNSLVPLNPPISSSGTAKRWIVRRGTIPCCLNSFNAK